MLSNGTGGLATLPAGTPARIRTAAAPPPLSSVHVGNACGAGGSGRVFAELSRCLPDFGIRFTGAVAEPDNVAALTCGRVRLFASARSSMGTRLRGSRRTLLELLDTEKPDIFASHFALYSAPVIERLYRQEKPAFITHFHGPWAAESIEEGASTGAGRAKQMLERLVYRRADRVIVLSDAFASIAEEDYGVPEDRIRIVPGCVDTDRFHTDVPRRDARELLGLPLDRPLLVTVRRLVNRMGLLPLVEAMRHVSRAVPDTLLLIAGTGPLHDRLRSAVRELFLEDSVRLLGFVDDERLSLLYRAADLNLMPSQSLEGFGLVALEALAAGTPSLISAACGFAERIRDLSPALVFPSTHPGDMAQYLIEALRGNETLPSEVQCRDFVLRSYTSAAMAKRTAAVYREVA